MDTCESAWHLLNAAGPQPCHTANLVPPLCAACVTGGGGGVSAGTLLALQLLNPLQPAGLLRTYLAHVAWPRVSG